MQSPPLTYQYSIELQQTLYFDRNSGNSGTNPADFDPGADVVITGLILKIIPNDSRLPELTIIQGDSALQDPNNDGNYVDNDFIKTYGDSKIIGINQIKAAAARPIVFDLTDPNGSGMISGEYPVIGQAPENGFFYPPVSFPILDELHDLELYRDLDEFMDEGGTIQDFNPVVFDPSNILASTPSQLEYRNILREGHGFTQVNYENEFPPFDPELHLAEASLGTVDGALRHSREVAGRDFVQDYGNLEQRTQEVEGGFRAFTFPEIYATEANAFIDELLGLSTQTKETEPEEEPNLTIDPELLGPIFSSRDLGNAYGTAGDIARTRGFQFSQQTHTTEVFHFYNSNGQFINYALVVPWEYSNAEEAGGLSNPLYIQVENYVAQYAIQKDGSNGVRYNFDKSARYGGSPNGPNQTSQLQQEKERISLVDRFKKWRNNNKDRRQQRRDENAADEAAAESLNNDLPPNLQENVNTRVVDGATLEGGGRGILKPTKEQKQAARKKRKEERKARKAAAKRLKELKKQRRFEDRVAREAGRQDQEIEEQRLRELEEQGLLNTRVVEGRDAEIEGRGLLPDNTRIASGRNVRRERRQDFVDNDLTTRYVQGRGGDADGRGIIRTQVNQRTVSGASRSDIDGSGIINLRPDQREEFKQRKFEEKVANEAARQDRQIERERNYIQGKIDDFNTRTVTGRTTNERKENKRKSRKLFLKTFGPYTKTVTGRIIDSETNKPIEGATIEFVTYYEGELLLTYEGFMSGQFGDNNINRVVGNLSQGQNNGRYREQYRTHLAYRINPETGLKEIDPFYEETVGLDGLFKPGSGPREEVVSITTGRNGRFKINVFSGEGAGPAVLKIGAEGYITIDKPAVGKDGSKRFNLGTIPLDPDPGLDADDAILENSPVRLKRRERRKLRLEKLDLKDAKSRASFQDGMLANLFKKALGLLVPFGITAGLAVLKKANPFDDINTKCPTDDKLDELIKKRNNLKAAIESAYITIEAATLTIELTNGFINATKILLNGLTALPFPLGITVPATAVTTVSSQIEDRKKDIPKFQALSTAILTYLVLLGALLQTILRLLQIVDSAIQKCKQEANLPPVNPDLLSLIEPEVEQGIPTFRGFRFEIEVENTTSQYKRRRAAAIDVNGVVVLRSEYSFTDDTNILIEELKFYITQNDLKAE